MNICIIIPAYNEDIHIAQTLQSLVEQTLLPKKIIVVNDNSTDETQAIIDSFSEKYSFIEGIINVSETSHQPGSKVINAFQRGFEGLSEAYDVICKFDADLIFPKTYLERISSMFKSNERCGMAGGHCYIEKKKEWVLESLTNKDHIRGALKAYRKECFDQIGGLKNEMGWDTVDELLAQFHGWEIHTDNHLKVKHLKPTGKAYSKKAKWKQGEAFYKMRYGILLTHIASAKLAIKKSSFRYYMNCIKGFYKSKRKKEPFMVSEEEGRFIRNLRWKNIKNKVIRT